jgi:DNA-binding NtrC family response regulator
MEHRRGHREKHGRGGVVDESAAVLELAEQALRACGYLVLVTHDPLEALAVACRVRVDLVVARTAMLDRLRPELNSPRMLVIASSDDKRSIPSSLREPFSLPELQGAVANALHVRAT